MSQLTPVSHSPFPLQYGKKHGCANTPATPLLNEVFACETQPATEYKYSRICHLKSPEVTVLSPLLQVPAPEERPSLCSSLSVSYMAPRLKGLGAGRSFLVIRI
jgi:hypothetical protein